MFLVGRGSLLLGASKYCGHILTNNHLTLTNHLSSYMSPITKRLVPQVNLALSGVEHC